MVLRFSYSTPIIGGFLSDLDCIFVDGKPFFGLPYDFKITLKEKKFQTKGMPEIAYLATKIQFLDHFTIDTLIILLL